MLGALAAALIPISATSTPAYLTVTKSFEFGPGTANPISNVRTFNVPSGLEVAATVKYKRLGTGKGGIPITIELREPDTAPGVEGPIVDSENREAQTIESSVTIRSLASNRGCTKPWRVRVRYAGTDAGPANPVHGTIRMDWDATMKRINTETPGYVIKGTSKEVKMGPSTGFGEGQMGITANWNHMIGPVPGPSPVKFRVFVIERRPGVSGDIIYNSEEAYSSNEANATPRFGLVQRFSSAANGQFYLHFDNRDNHDAFVQTPVVNFSPTCG